MNAPYFEDYTEDWSYVTESTVVTDEDIAAFVELHKFHTPTFTDMNYVKSSADYGARMAPGLFALCAAEGLVLRAGLTRKRGIFLMELSPKFQKPVFAGDTLVNRVRLASKKMTSKSDRGVVVTAHEVVNQKGEVVISYLSTRMIRTRAYVEVPAAAA
ncbi:MaoC family dehydratase N-terminal domain-containing protein [Comamonas sp. Y33R10-2]|uniref:MaoC family dehydratase n=1 Tax=Comamonas sp. Y33R10-2 TaxID=2853257 RepID=UPI001C5CABC5|nr:MaoC family dehydratase N-terminal domain-containing protein [Comamonas sp. Y33R10-2]QXZ10676.1 MaoC family dehydratase N-terminal domain-containing protein [Comamonas sp. Y33R10-2]